METPLTMRAALRHRYCPGEQLQVETVDVPRPGDQEILVKVHATTVNRTDCAVVSGKPYIMRLFTGLLKPRLPVPGTDFAGEVVALGKGVSTYEVGDKVWGFFDEGLGSQAEYVLVNPKTPMGLLPTELSFAQAAASLEGAHYANNFLNKIELPPGSKVLLNGATGAIGSATLQFLKARDIQVTAVCNTPNVQRIKELGADKVYDYLKEDFLRDDEVYDAVFDAVGKSTFGKCRHLLRKGGVYLSSELGRGWQNPFLALLTMVFGNKRVIFPLPQKISESIEFIKREVESGHFLPLIDRSYPLEQIADAYPYVASGEKTGNVVIEMC